MGWAKFDDQFTDHPKVQAVGAMAELLAMRAVIFAARFETDGLIRESVLPRLTIGIPNPKRHVEALCRERLWEECGDGWVIHDFLDYHPSKSERDAEREAAKDRMRAVRANKRRTTPARSGEQAPNNSNRSDYPDPVPHTSPNGDGLFEAFFAAWTGRDYVPNESMPKTQRGRINAAVKEAKQAGIDAGDVTLRGERYRKAWPGIECAPQALLGNWSRFGDESEPPPPFDPAKCVHPKDRAAFVDGVGYCGMCGVEL